MMPYLHDVDLEEHYFVQGPSNRKAEAIQHFAKLGETKSLLTSLQFHIKCISIECQ